MEGCGYSLKNTLVCMPIKIHSHFHHPFLPDGHRKSVRVIIWGSSTFMPTFKISLFKSKVWFPTCGSKVNLRVMSQFQEDIRTKKKYALKHSSKCCLTSPSQTSKYYWDWTDVYRYTTSDKRSQVDVALFEGVTSQKKIWEPMAQMTTWPALL